MAWRPSPLRSGVGNVAAKLRQRLDRRSRQRGFTLIELVVTVAIAGLVIASLNGIVGTTLESQRTIGERNDLVRQARFAMDRMVRAVSHSGLLLLPLADNPATSWRENVRQQTVPPLPPEGDSTKATAVLAVTLPSYSDLDFDGFPDADNDRDGRLDEDPMVDRNNDTSAGIFLIDDDGDGAIDEGAGPDDDEDGYLNEDAVNGLDDDKDGSVDEDSNNDVQGDGCPGICMVDDDNDGNTDEGSGNDDDEDGKVGEDWYDALVFYLDNGTLKERLPVPWDEDGMDGITGRDVLISDLADNVTALRFERLASGSRNYLVEISIELTGPNGQMVSLTTRVRVGGAL